MADKSSESVIELLTRLRNHLREWQPELPIIKQAAEMIDDLKKGNFISHSTIPAGYKIWDVQDFDKSTPSACPRACKAWRVGDQLIHLKPQQ